MTFWAAIVPIVFGSFTRALCQLFWVLHKSTHVKESCCWSFGWGPSIIGGNTMIHQTYNKISLKRSDCVSWVNASGGAVLTLYSQEHLVPWELFLVILGPV